MDNSSLFNLAALITVAGVIINDENKTKRKAQGQRPRARRWWVRPIYTVEARRNQGYHDNLILEMRLSDPEKFTQWFRMSTKSFDKLLSFVGPSITKSYMGRVPIDPCTKLEVTIR